MSKELDELLAGLFGQRDEINLIRMEFSDSGLAFVAYADNGDAYNGTMGDPSLTLEVIKERLIGDIQSGNLGKYFSRYNPADPADIAAFRAKNSDWADIYNAA